MVVAVRNGCRVCISIHSGRPRQFGHAELSTPLRDQGALADPALEAVRVFTLRLLETTGEVPDQQVQEFLAAGYTQQNALEIVFGIGASTMSTFANRLVRA
jgi:alkylhydroperoxidase family enzyme